MNFFIAAIELPNLSERRDPPRQEPPLPVFLRGDQHRPTVTLEEVPLGSRPGDAPRLGHVEDQEARRLERLVDAVEQSLESRPGIAAVEEEIETLAERGDRGTRWELRGQERFREELRPRRPTSGEGDHGLGEVDPQDLITRVGERPRPDPAAAAEIDHPPAVDPLPPEDRQQSGRGVPGEVAESGIMDVR
jgi:hypothetical protein